MKLFKVFLTATALSAVTAASASALSLKFDSSSISSNSLASGAAGEVDMTFSDAGGQVRVSAIVRNTTGMISFGAGATKGKLTGFGFDLLPGVAFAGTFTSGSFLDETLLNAAFNPFGSLDLAFADNSNFLGGNPKKALPEGRQDSFAFALALGAFGDAAALEAAFQNAFASGTLDAGLRFQQVNAGAGSDKLLLAPQVSAVPLPAAGLLLAFGLGALALFRRRIARAA